VTRPFENATCRSESATRRSPAHTFGFIFPNVGQGVYTLCIEVAVDSGATVGGSATGDSGTAIGGALTGSAP
jgi:hypothetical protein